MSWSLPIRQYIVHLSLFPMFSCLLSIYSFFFLMFIFLSLFILLRFRTILLSHFPPPPYTVYYLTYRRQYLHSPYKLVLWILILPSILLHVVSPFPHVLLSFYIFILLFPSFLCLCSNFFQHGTVLYSSVRLPNLSVCFPIHHFFLLTEKLLLCLTHVNWRIQKTNTRMQTGRLPTCCSYCSIWSSLNSGGKSQPSIHSFYNVPVKSFITFYL